jgi:hypothetical protein
MGTRMTRMRRMTRILFASQTIKIIIGMIYYNTCEARIKSVKIRRIRVPILVVDKMKTPEQFA